MAANRTTRPRTAPARTSDKPKITGLNLDKLEREGRPEEPYRTVLNGKLFTFVDPADHDWQEHAKLDTDDAVAVLKFLMEEEDWAAFREIRMPAWKLIALARDVQKYYRISDEDEGNDGASRI